MIIPILVATVASLGLGLILSDLLRVPSFAVSKSTHNLGKRQNKKTNPIELWLKEIAGTLAGKLKINEYKRLQLEADLRTADMPMTPEHAGEELRRELEITVADRRSGTAEVALSRLAARVGGSMMPDIVMGLKSTLNGDNTAVYWALLNIKFAEAQRTALKAEASKAPKRVKRLSMVLLVCFMLIYVVVIGQTLLSSLGGLFG